MRNQGSWVLVLQSKQWGKSCWHWPKQLLLPKALVAALVFTGCLTTKCKNCRCAYYTTSVLSVEKVFLSYLRRIHVPTVEVFSYPIFILSCEYFVSDRLPPARSCFIDLSRFCPGYHLFSCVLLSVWYWQGPVSTTERTGTSKANNACRLAYCTQCREP